MKYAPAFDKLVRDAKSGIEEVSIDAIAERVASGQPLVLIDTREDHEFATSHLPTAIHIGRGILERDIEGKYPDFNAELVLYCGGGGRSALSAESLKKMGYTRVLSMAGGFRGWKEAGHAIVTPANAAVSSG
jgi:rhodanese-related sulfurtransferase